MSTTKPVPKAPTRKHEENGAAGEGAATILSSKLEGRLDNLLDEQAKGQQIIANLTRRLEETRQRVLRIDGAIRVLEELTAEDGPDK